MTRSARGGALNASEVRTFFDGNEESASYLLGADAAVRTGADARHRWGHPLEIERQPS